jgi:hypothetical protein
VALAAAKHGLDVQTIHAAAALFKRQNPSALKDTGDFRFFEGGHSLLFIPFLSSRASFVKH